MSSGSVQHRQSIDLARFVAAFGVVVAHALASTRDWVGHLSLGLFLILTAFLAVQSMQRAGGRYPWIARARRLVVPWLFWCVVYRVVDLGVSDAPDRFVPLTNPWSLLIGPYIHLWFLPFVMLAMVLVQPIGRLITGPRALALACVALVAVSLPLFWAHYALPLPEPLPQWAFALPLYVYGLLVAYAHQMGRAAWPLLAMGVISIWGYALSGQPWALQALIAALGFEAFWRLPLRHRLLPALGKVAFGIYLMHPFFMLVLWKFMGPQVDWLTASILVFAMSWGATLILQRLPVLRGMV